MIVWGYALWWRRRALVQITLWQALAAASWPARLAVLLLAAALGWGLPVLGVSLLLFLALDALLMRRPSSQRSLIAARAPR